MWHFICGEWLPGPGEYALAGPTRQEVAKAIDGRRGRLAPPAALRACGGIDCQDAAGAAGEQVRVPRCAQVFGQVARDSRLARMLRPAEAPAAVVAPPVEGSPWPTDGTERRTRTVGHGDAARQLEQLLSHDEWEPVEDRVQLWAGPCSCCANPDELHVPAGARRH